MTNPIIQRELVGMLRTRKALVLQILLIIVLSALVILRWPTDARADLDGHLAQQVMNVFGYGLMVGLLLLAPVFPATSIVLEKQRGTLALLLNSPMSQWSILLGKLVGVLGFVILLLLMSLPAAAACYVMGGIDLGSQLAPLYLVLAVLAIQYGMLGLLVSTYANNAESAMRITYGVILIMSILTLVPYQFRRGLVESGLASLLDWFRCISPIPAVMDLLGHGELGGFGITSGQDATGKYLILAVISIVVFALMTAARLRQRVLDRPRSKGLITDEQSEGVQRYRRVMFMWFFDPKRRSSMIGDWTNPVMIKEFRARRFGRSHWIMRIIGGTLLVSLGLMLITTKNSEDWGVATLGSVLVILQMGLIVLITPSLASGLISGERESGGWQLMQMTPLSTWRIVVGKLISVIWLLLLLQIATLPGYAVMIYIDTSNADVVVRVLICLVLTACFALLLSAAVSSLFKRTGPATTIAYSVLILICAGTMLFWLGADAPFTHQTVETVLKANPLAAALSIIQLPGFEQYNLVPHNWWIIGGASVACLLVLIVRVYQLGRPQ